MWEFAILSTGGLDPTLVEAGIKEIPMEGLGAVRIDREQRPRSDRDSRQFIKKMEIIEKKQEKMGSQSFMCWSY